MFILHPFCRPLDCSARGRPHQSFLRPLTPLEHRLRKLLPQCKTETIAKDTYIRLICSNTSRASVRTHMHACARVHNIAYDRFIGRVCVMTWTIGNGARGHRTPVLVCNITRPSYVTDIHGDISWKVSPRSAAYTKGNTLQKCDTCCSSCAMLRRIGR